MFRIPNIYLAHEFFFYLKAKLFCIKGVKTRSFRHFNAATASLPLLLWVISVIGVLLNVVWRHYFHWLQLQASSRWPT